MFSFWVLDQNELHEDCSRDMQNHTILQYELYVKVRYKYQRLSKVVMESHKTCRLLLIKLVVLTHKAAAFLKSLHYL